MTVVTAAIHVATLTVAAKKGGECNCEVMHHSLRQLQSRWYRQYHVHHSSTKTKNKITKTTSFFLLNYFQTCKCILANVY
jgi:hypothetical protein